MDHGDLGKEAGSHPGNSIRAHTLRGGDSMKLIQRFFQIVLATLREIFDENSYQRFLLRTSSFPSVESYSKFVHERDAAMSKKPRCC
jgi:hypothetical protein